MSCYPLLQHVNTATLVRMDRDIGQTVTSSLSPLARSSPQPSQTPCRPTQSLERLLASRLAGYSPAVCGSPAHTVLPNISVGCSFVGMDAWNLSRHPRGDAQEDCEKGRGERRPGSGAHRYRAKSKYPTRSESAVVRTSQPWPRTR